jgi:hypothetical protein
LNACQKAHTLGKTRKMEMRKEAITVVSFTKDTITFLNLKKLTTLFTCFFQTIVEIRLLLLARRVQSLPTNP